MTTTALARRKPTTITVLPPTAMKEAKDYVPEQSFTKLDFWDALSKQEQSTLVTEGRSLAASMIVNATSGLAIGFHLKQIQTLLLKKRGAFTHFLNHQFNAKNPSTAYRYIREYERLEGMLPDNLLRAMVAKGVALFSASPRRPLGSFTEAFELLRSNGELPPNSEDPDTNMRYIRKLERTREELQQDPRKLRAITRKLDKAQEEWLAEQITPATRQRDAYRLARAAMRDMTSKEKLAWLDDLVGYLMTEAGIQSARQFHPGVIPEEYKQGRGRPPKSEQPSFEAA